jgi:hypothetical protein
MTRRKRGNKNHKNKTRGGRQRKEDEKEKASGCD